MPSTVLSSARPASKHNTLTNTEELKNAQRQGPEPTYSDHMHSDQQSIAQKSSPERKPQPLSEENTTETVDLRYKGGVDLPKEAALVIVVGTLSPYLGFCWWLMLMSLPVTYYYAKFVINSFRQQREGISTCEIPKFAIHSLLKGLLLVGMIYWCFAITPLHLFTRTPMDAWTPYAVHEPLRMAEVVYDPGQNASIE